MKKRIGFLAFIIFIIIVVVLWFSLEKPNSQILLNYDYPQIVKRDTLRVVTEYNAVGYYVDGDTIAGFNHDLIQLLSHYYSGVIDVSLESDINKAVFGLYTGKYDVLASDMPITSTAKDYLSFTQSVINSKQVLVQRKDKNTLVRSVLDLAKKTIYLPEYSFARQRLGNLQEEIADTIFCIERRLYNPEQLVMEVSAGDIDYTICDEHTAKKLSKKLLNIDIQTSIGFTHMRGWGVRQNSPILLDSLNSWLQNVEGTPRFKQIYSKYYTR